MDLKESAFKKSNGVSAAATAVGASEYCPDVETSGVDEKKLIRKIDIQVVPWLATLYLLSFIDRGTIGNAKVLSFTIHLFLLTHPSRTLQAV
jgi:predicted transcriptional regulator